MILSEEKIYFKGPVDKLDNRYAYFCLFQMRHIEPYTKKISACFLCDTYDKGWTFNTVIPHLDLGETFRNGQIIAYAKVNFSHLEMYEIQRITIQEYNFFKKKLNLYPYE